MTNSANTARSTVSTTEARAPRTRRHAQAKAASQMQWSNWARTQSCTPSCTHQPQDAEGIASVIRTAAAEGSTVRPMGAGHSFTSVATTDGHRVQLDRCAGLVSLDTDNQTATLRAGTRLRDTPSILRPMGWALPNQGDVDPQSLAGAISTGTHGTGLGFTGFAGTVKGFKIVTADGVERHCHPGAEGIDGELYRLGRLGLGIFGVLSEVTMSVVPAFDLRADEHREDFEFLRNSFAERCKSADHLEFFWFPGQREALVKHNTRIPPQQRRRPSRSGLRRRIGKLRTYFNDEVVNNMGLMACCEVAKAIPATTDAINRLATNTVPERQYEDEAHKVFVSPRRVRFAEMEYSVPLEAVGEVLGEIRSALERKKMKISFPVEVRSASADDVPLSTAFGRDSAYIAVHRYWKENFREYFQLIEDIVKAHEGRPHWGKLHTLTSADFAERYPLFDEVVSLREKLDPKGMFLNDHLRGIFT
ncbi:MAG: D-arabinono-1,4-lactone oxidase [Corynebacterium sp.]|uniref:D-arabinono-1,4-lactone oxidase n=1 Tax=Corynebacterium sp. TaxID=1720 RepID=UPI0026DC356B|nr:D-arabinono-1,4-lactone oxidase [Corynebacterium sp.]MDO5029623.1 D-arabinono-1,4-lactone oxidase [Corynebacterium sp.]